MVAFSSWADVADSYRLHLVSLGRSGETIKTYVAYTGLVYRWAQLRETDLVTADKRFVATFLADSSRNYSRNTIRNYTCALRSFFKFCMAEGWRPDDPTASFSVRKPKQQSKRPFTQDEVQAMKDAAESSVDTALLMLLMGTGIRIGEAVKVRVQDIDKARGVLLIQGKGNKQRWVAPPPGVVKTLVDLAGERTTGPLLLNQDRRPMGRERARKRLVALGDKAHVVNVYPHRFRITFANHFLESGGDMQALQDALGHEDISTTAHYAGFSKAQRALDQMRRFNLTLRLE